VFINKWKACCVSARFNLCLSKNYGVALSLLMVLMSLNILRRMLVCLMGNDLEGMWKEAFVA
jgi:hypothetical protein